jgi:hypothetical protein
MPTVFPHLQGRIGEDLWVPIGEDSASTLYSSGIQTSRVEGSPNFLELHAADLQENLGLSPPTYSQVRNAGGPEFTRFIRTEEETAPESTISTERRGHGQSVMSRHLTDLDNIRHEEIAGHIHMDGRISAVPHYPVYLEAPATYPTRHRSRSPVSVASSSTTAVFISVGQLPGSEPFDPFPPPTNMYQSDPSSISSPNVRPQTSSANSFRTEATVSGPLLAQPASTGGHVATVSQISWFWDDLSQEYWKPPDRGYYAPEARSNFRHTIHWSNRQDSRDQLPSCRSLQRPASPNLVHPPPPPPPPPPKDPGYVARPRNNGKNRCLDKLRQCRSGTLRRRKDK